MPDHLADREFRMRDVISKSAAVTIWRVLAKSLPS
jgi:hypothetical protein